MPKKPGTCPTPKRKRYDHQEEAPSKAYHCGCGAWHLSPRRTKGDGSLFKRGDGLWVACIEVPSPDDGKRRQKRVAARDYKTALAKLRKLREDLAKGVITTGANAVVPVTDETTAAVWLRYWLDAIKGPHIRPNTFDYYDEAIRLHITPSIGEVRLNELTPGHIRAMLAAVNTPANAQRAHKTVKIALKAAVVEGLIARNVAEAVAKPGHVKRVRGSLTSDAAKLVIRTAIDLQTSRDETSPLLATRWAAAFLTGARPGELLGLEWDRVDLTNGVFDLSWQLQQLDRAHGCGDPDKAGAYPCGKKRPSFCEQPRWDFSDGFVYRECIGSLVWTKPKTAAGTRIVPIVAPLRAMLDQHRADTAAAPNPHGLVWHRRDGYPITRHDDAAAWRAVLTAAELPSVEVYATRHTAATLLQELGVPREVRMRITGHSSAAAHDEYIHIDQTQTRAALGKLQQLLLG